MLNLDATHYTPPIKEISVLMKVLLPISSFYISASFNPQPKTKGRATIRTDHEMQILAIPLIDRLIATGKVLTTPFTAITQIKIPN